MSMSLQELGAKVSFEYSDGKVVITDDSVEFYGTQSLDSHDYAPFPAFSLDFDNFDRLIAAYDAYTSTEG